MVKYQIIPFSKPTHETDGRYWVNLDIRKIEAAKKNKEWIVVKLPQGCCKPVSPENLLKYGKRTEAVYLYPNNPMKLVGSYFELLPKEKEEEIRNRNLIYSMG